ncbi:MULTISPECIES: MerR family transcriptional regulator [unclassified Geodermatophilus]
MSGDLLRSGEFLRRTRLSAKALRLYAEQGLLVPDAVDPWTGYRGYAAAQVDRARLIAALRRAGMPLARVREVVDLDPAARRAAVARWWDGVEEDLRRRRTWVGALTVEPDDEEDDVTEVTLREVAEQTVLTAERRLTVDELEDFITGASEEIDAHLARSGAVPAGPLRVVYHGMVTEDGDGPVEVVRPFTGRVEPAGELRIRLQQAGREAVTCLSRRQAEFPGILRAYDAVGAWVDARGLERAGSPAEVYLSDRDVAPDEPHVEVAWPVA